MTRRLLAAALVLAVAAASALGWALRPAPPPIHRPDPRLVTLRPLEEAPRPDPPPGAPNLVLVIGCTVRKDQTSIHGGTGATPFLQRLADQGARLEDLVTAAPWTRAAGTAILTGRHPISVGMAEPGPQRDERVLDERVVTLAEHLRAQGYATAGLTTNPNLNRLYGFAQGFDVYRQLAKLWREEGIKLPGDLAVEEAAALLDQLPQRRPIYLQVVLIDAHAPFTASRAELARLADPSVPEAVVRYRASLRRMDAAIASLDRLLRQRGLDPGDTVFAFANDHGDGLGWPAHHGDGHGRQLWPSATGGVFVVRGPGIPAGRAVQGVASQIDLAPTLAGLLGLPPFPGAGVDASAALRGLTDRVTTERAFSETWFKEADRAAITTAEAACQLDLAGEGRGFVDGCFDRRADPEHRSVRRDPALEQALRDWRAERTAEAEAFGEPPRADPDPLTEAQLEALGYTAD